MSLNKDDVNRALKILQSLLQETEQSLEDIGGYSPDVFEQFSALQSVVEVMDSPLFSSLVKLMNHYQQTIEKSQLRSDPFTDNPGPASTELKLGTDKHALSQFQQHYGINQPKAPSSSDPPGKGSIVPVAPLKLAGCTSTFVGDQSFHDSPSITRSKVSTSPRATKEQKWKVFKKVVGRKKKVSNPKAVSLADLACDKKAGSDSGEFDMREKPSKTLNPSLVISNDTCLSSSTCSDVEEEDSLSVTPAITGPLESGIDNGLKEEIGAERTSFKLDTSLVYSNEECITAGSSPTTGESIPPELDKGSLINTTKPISPAHSSVDSQGACETTGGPMDLLYCMRHRESQEQIKQYAQSRKPREVKLRKTAKAIGGFGWDLVGLSSTGVFVSRLYSGGSAVDSGIIQEGDQVLKLNELDTGTMASFEVEMFIREAPVDVEMRVLMQHNPIGWLDFQKVSRKWK